MTTDQERVKAARREAYTIVVVGMGGLALFLTSILLVATPPQSGISNTIGMMAWVIGVAMMLISWAEYADVTGRQKKTEVGEDG